MTKPTTASLEAEIKRLSEALEKLATEMTELRDTMIASIADVDQRMVALEETLGARNKSAPTKRSMTNADALKVLTDPAIALLDHKEAAAAVGLTYAQVYSCRKEFTFKHVHKELRDAKWKNPWAR